MRFYFRIRREKREKVNITWPENDFSRVSYYLRLTYFLDRELSVGNPDTDMVQALSLPCAVSLTFLSVETFLFPQAIFPESTVSPIDKFFVRRL